MNNIGMNLISCCTEGHKGVTEVHKEIINRKGREGFRKGREGLLITYIERVLLYLSV